MLSVVIVLAPLILWLMGLVVGASVVTLIVYSLCVIYQVDAVVVIAGALLVYVAFDFVRIRYWRMK